MVDERESTFSFSLLDKRGLLETRVRSSSTEVVGEAVLTVSAIETIGVTETEGVEEGPFPMTHTVFLPMLDNDSSFFDLIFAYISLLTRSTLTLFSLNLKVAQDKCRRLRAKAIKG